MRRPVFPCRPTPATVAFLFLWTLGATTCAWRPEPPARHVLLISIDSLRADHLGCYGNPREASPRLDALAGDGTRFARAYAPSSWTLPSHATLLTGMTQRTHGAVMPHRRIVAGVRMLAKILRAAGFKTAGVYSGPFLAPLYGFNRGFESYESCQSIGKGTGRAARRLSHSDKTNPCLQRTFARWIEDAAPGERHFWFVHMWDPHYDYIPPDRYVRRFDPTYRGRLDGRNVIGKGFPPTANQRDIAHLLARYDGEIRYTDDTIATMLTTLDAAGLLADTLVVVTADHGEEFREHGGKGHQSTVFAETTSVPLLFQGPRVPRGRVVARPVGLVDVAPTILELIDGPAAEMEGVSLLALMRGDPTPERAVLSVLYHPAKGAEIAVKAMAIRSRDLTLLRSGFGQPWVTFDPIRDVLEQTPMPVDDQARLQDATAALEGAAMPRVRPGADPGDLHLPRELQERLRGLGYL